MSPTSTGFAQLILHVLCFGSLCCQKALAHEHASAAFARHLAQLDDGLYSTVRVADFSTLPSNISQDSDIPMPTLQLEGLIRVSSEEDEASLSTAVPPGPDEVKQLAQLISDELPYKPPSEAVPVVVDAPVVALRGMSGRDTASAAAPPLRFPTVYAPPRAGVVFRLASRGGPPGVTLHLSNMTLLLPNTTYAGIYDSGIMDYMDIGTGAQFCFTNSILALKSCEGYPRDTYHVWCCTQSQCGVLYTQQVMMDAGYDFGGSLEFIQCAAAGDPVSDGSPGQQPGRGPVARAAAAAVLVALMAALFTVAVRARRGEAQHARDELDVTKQMTYSEVSLKVAGFDKQMESLRSTRSTEITSEGFEQSGAGQETRPLWARAKTRTAGVTTSVGFVTDVYDTAAAVEEQTAVKQKARLVAELDHMRRRGESFLGQFVVLPATERREGGQGVVQFMRRAHTEEAVAVKFFLSRRAFDTEVQLYRVDVLRSMMPAVRLEVGNIDSTERNGRGYPWPPCMVLEKGESLQEWKAKTQPAVSTILDAMCLIAERLTQLHGSGWVHRDLKPGNVLRLPGQHSWTLMDFGCAALSGHTVPLTFSASYAPPEVAQAVERGARTIVADPAADMWALGVMAFELLTSAPLFPPFTPREAIWAQLCGREALPWEAGAPGCEGKLAQLRVLRGAVRHCLQRRPEDRPTAREVVWQLRSLFEPQANGRQSHSGNMPASS